MLLLALLRSAATGSHECVDVGAGEHHQLAALEEWQSLLENVMPEGFFFEVPVGPSFLERHPRTYRLLLHNFTSFRFLLAFGPHADYYALGTDVA
jgi:hypothetical protein